jgi:hypothetical protein
MGGAGFVHPTLHFSWRFIMSSFVRGLLLASTLVFGAGCASTSSPGALSGDGMPRFATIRDDSRNETIPVKKADDDDAAVRPRRPLSGSTAGMPERKTARRFARVSR